MSIGELKFYSPEDYINFDFDDCNCFFYDELQAYGQENPHDPAMVDYEGRFKKIIKDLFKVYEVLIINPEEETLLGLIGQTKILIRRSTII